MTTPAHFKFDALLKQATERTGLSDFGDDHFRVPLQRYLRACVEDGYVPAAGFARIGESVVAILINRLRFHQILREHPEILDEEIRTPLFVLGSPGRVGSTKMHRLLANAFEVQSTPLWQVMNPVPLDGARPGHPDGRIALAEGFCGQIRERQPQLYAAIQPIATEPDEDPYLFDMSFMQFMFNAVAHVPSYMHWIYQQDWEPTYRHHKKMLQYLQWQNRGSGQAMLLKGPSHTGHLDMMFKVFPDAKFIQIHRDPVTCIASMAKVVQLLQALQPARGSATLKEAAELLSFFTRHHLMENLRIREAQPEIPIIDFYYEEVCDNALELADKIFKFWGQPLSQPSRERIAAWEHVNNQHKLGKFEYSVEDAGLDRAQFEATIAPYMQRFYPQRMARN